jgi:uncharacterized protein (TIGR02996 family)
MRDERWLRRNPALEQAWLDGDDVESALVYADWLHSHDNPWGELISLQCRGGDEARLDEVVGELELPEDDLATVGWRHGRFDWVRLENERDWMGEDFDAVALARRLFTLPMSDWLRTLRIGVQRWEHGADDVPAILREAATHPFAGHLRRLHVGDISQDIDLSHFAFGDLSGLSGWFPHLQELVLRGGDQSWDRADSMEFGVLRLPRLRSLTFETCSMSERRLGGLVASELPSLERLEVWFGSERYHALGALGASTVAPLLDRQKFPKLSWLGLRNSEFTDAVGPFVWASSLAQQLEGLDLSMGVLSTTGAQTLATLARVERAATGALSTMPRLRVLDVSDNFLSPDDVAALVEAFAGVEVRSTSQKTPLEGGERYVTAAE